MRYQHIPELHRCHLFTFDSVTDMIDNVLAIQNKDSQIRGRCDRSERSEWVGRPLSSFHAVKVAVESLWADGMATYEKLRDELRDVELPRPKSIKRKASWSEEGGDELSVERLQRGNAYWRTTSRDHRPGPLSCTVITDTSAPWTRSSEEIAWRGVASVLLTELLENAGYRVELWAVNYATGGYANNDYHAAAVCLKQGSDPMDVSTLINAISGWYYRTAWFGAISLADKAVDGHCGYYPNAEDPNRLMPLVPHLTQDEQLTICAGVFSARQATEFIKEQIEKLK